jgi:hypothetical protein
MKKFYFTLKNSLYGPPFYRQVLEEPLGRALRYYFKLIALAALVVAIIWTIVLTPVLTRFLTEAGEAALEVFPADLAVTVSEGEARVAPTDPYFVAWPTVVVESDFDWGGPRPANLAVINTQAEFSESLWQEADTLLLLTKNSVAVETDRGLEIKPLSTFGNFTLTRARVENAVHSLRPWLAVLAPLIFLGLWLAGFVAGAAYLIALFLIALLVWLLARLKTLGLTYGQAYRVALYAATAAVLARALAWLLVPGANLYFLPTILLLLVATLNLKPPAELVAKEIE